jgi:hypothetical protein
MFNKNVSVVWGARATGTNLYWCSDSWHKTNGHICPAQQPFIWIAKVQEGWATKKTFHFHQFSQHTCVRDESVLI